MSLYKISWFLWKLFIIGQCYKTTTLTFAKSVMISKCRHLDLNLDMLNT
jgi:hypothetical protein